MNGTFASEMPPCVRRRWPRRPERSWSFSDAPMQVSARLMTATSPSRSSGSSNRRAAIARSHTASTPGIALATFMTSAGSRLAPLQQPDPRLEHEERELGRVDVGQRHADELEHVLDAVLLERTLLRALRGEVDAATREVHVLAELPAQLVLRRDGHDPGAVA